MNTDEINKWAKKLMETHKNPLTKLELSGTKFFLPAETDEEKELVKNSLTAVTNALQSERVERRCARSLANWLPEQRLAEVTKIVGLLKYGFANKNGRFLYPEEILFLLETNRLELLWNNVPVSIQQAYEIILNESEDSLEKYMTYRKLALQGFRLVRPGHVREQESLGEPSPKKCRLSESHERQDSNTSHFVSTDTLLSSDSAANAHVTQTSDSDEMFKKIFKDLQANGPQKYDRRLEAKKDSDYKLFLPENSSRTSPDFDLRIFQGECMEPNMSFLDEKIPTIIGYTSSQFVGYFRIGNVNLPDLT